MGRLQGKYIADNFEKSERKGILILEGPNTDKNSDAFSILLFEELNKFNLCTDEYCMSIKVDKKCTSPFVLKLKVKSK